MVKIPFCFATSITSLVSIPIFLQIIASSFIKAMFISLCVFSITFEASIILIELALYVPLVLNNKKSSTHFDTFSFEPLVTFFIDVILLILSPGLILSGL